MSRTLLMPPERVRRTLTRLAYEIVERNRGADGLELVGIRRRGAALAAALGEIVGGIEGRAFPAWQLDVSRFRDDRPADTSADDASAMPPDVTGRDVILVDDVLFTGRTARAALDALVRYGRPRTIQLVVLVDRGHREVPIQPDYVGRRIPTKHRERVVLETDPDLALFLDE